jgi:hypothetical protein
MKLKYLLITILLLLTIDFCYRHRPYFEREITFQEFGYYTDYDFCDKENKIGQETTEFNHFDCSDKSFCAPVSVTTTRWFTPCYKSTLHFK